MDQDQARLLIERGERAAALLANPDFTEVVNDLSQDYLAQLVASPPGERGREPRETAHLLHYALNQIVATLAQRVEVGVRQQQAIEAEEDEEE